MKQALHIVVKDVRRLWPLLLLTGGLFALLAVSPATGNETILVLLACWILGGSVVLEDAPAQESPFWLTRPYRRSSLLAAKVSFLMVFVFLPLLGAALILEARAGASLVANAHSLFVLELMQASWMILPALAIGAITRNLPSFAGVSVALTLLYFSMPRWTFSFRFGGQLSDPDNFLSMLPMVLSAIFVIALQYAVRKMQWTRVLLTASVCLSGFLLPLASVARMSMHVLNPGLDPDRIRVSFDESQPPRREKNCWSLPVKTEGLRPGTVLRTSGAETGNVQFGQESVGLIRTPGFQETAEGYREFFCVSGPVSAAPVDLHIPVNLEVLSVEFLATMPVHFGMLSAGTAGRCELLTPFPENTQLRCDLARPVVGEIGAGLEFSGYKVFSSPFQYSSAVSVTRLKFDGTQSGWRSGWPLTEAAERPAARFVLRTERVAANIRRELVYHQLRFPWTRDLPGGKK